METIVLCGIVMLGIVGSSITWALFDIRDELRKMNNR